MWREALAGLCTAACRLMRVCLLFFSLVDWIVCVCHHGLGKLASIELQLKPTLLSRMSGALLVADRTRLLAVKVEVRVSLVLNGKVARVQGHSHRRALPSVRALCGPFVGTLNG